jgi:hypothetical protein
MVAKRPWERVVIDAFETTETSLLSQYYNKLIVNFQREQRRLINEKQNIQKDLNASKDHAQVLLKKKNSGKKKQKN